MFKSETQLRVRYGETDKMGFVYYGNYATYYEVARVEALRDLGLSYKEMEDSGIMLPVVSYTINYFKPAFYDDLLTIKTVIPEIPRSKIIFDYECYNADNVLLNKGQTILVFVDVKTVKPWKAPEYLIDRMKEFYP